MKTAVPCFSCGRSSIVGRFCSDRCREWHDAGNPAHQPYNVLDYLPRQGPHGMIINCAHCKREFDSKGLRCCSKDCERALVRGETLRAEMGPLAAEPDARRQCEACEAKLPRWIKGKAVPKSRRFCSPRCQQNGRKTRESGIPHQTAKRTQECDFEPMKSGIGEGVSNDPRSPRVSL